jgi:hypothetical protein
LTGLTGRRALVLAYHFPPVGGAGVQRHPKIVPYQRECCN